MFACDSSDDEDIFEASALDCHAASVEVEDICGQTLTLSQQMRPQDLAPLFTEEWTGSQVWVASVELSHYLERQWRFLAPPSRGPPVVLELGAGCGLAGLTTCLLGASVVATDLDPMVPLLDRNGDSNLSECQRARYHAEVLSWGDADAMVTLQKKLAAMTQQNEEESGGALERSGGPDLIVVSDCLNPIYGEESYELLARTVLGMRGPSSLLLLAYQKRGPGSEILLETFFRHLGAAATGPRVAFAGPLAAGVGDDVVSRHQVFMSEGEVMIFAVQLAASSL